jgi:hypothetical protein
MMVSINHTGVTMKLLATAIIMLSFSSISYGKFKGEVHFTHREIERHHYLLEDILERSRDCLINNIQYHKRFYKKYGVSPYYGDNSNFMRMSYSEKVARVQSFGHSKKLAKALVSKMKPTSCIGLTIKCLRRGFEKYGTGKTWKKVEDFTNLNGVGGMALQHALQKLGWKVLYWNPDTSTNAYWDEREAKKYPNDTLHYRGHHEVRYRAMLRSGKYLYNRVDKGDDFINFYEGIPHRIYDVPFFVGTAHAGYHVFPGFNEWIIEGHSTRKINDPQTVEASKFSPDRRGGGPRGLYRSGLIAIPPGY